jgi:hypothetical protein
MKLIVHAKKSDPRVAAYLATRTDADVGEHVTYDGTPVQCDEVIVSAELANVDAICAAYKAEGIKVTTLSKHVEPPTPKAD